MLLNKKICLILKFNASICLIIFKILILLCNDVAHVQSATKECEVEKHCALQIPNAQIHDVTMVNLIETDMMEKLLLACNENNSDVILIIGNIGDIDKYFVTETIKNINDSKELPENIAILLSNIETKLNNIMPYKTVCGIRNQTLIIDLSGSDQNFKKYYEAVADLILQVVGLIHTGIENMPLHNVVSISDNNSTQQKDKKIVFKRHKTFISPPGTPPNTSTIKRYKESFPIISLVDALKIISEIICENIERTFETVQLSDAFGRILYETVKATYDLPPFKTSAKHGYAVLTTDGKGLRKVLESTSLSMSLEPGTCVWVKSGAPIPNGATAVVQAKDTRLIEKSESSDDTYVEIMIHPQNEQNIKPVGYDLEKGKTVLTPFTHIGPKEIALLAASGCKEVQVVKNLSIGIFSIGSNLEELEEPLKPGFVYDINRITLISLLKEKGFHPLDFGIVDNELASIQNKIGEALKKVDLLVTTGSTNDRGLLKTILETYCKADIHFGNISIKPGKSTILASCKIDDKKKYFLCLPGNPASALIVAQLFLLPFVNELHNLRGEHTFMTVYMKHQYTLHNRPRIAWAILEWNEDEEYASAFSNGNYVNDKLVSAAGANALLFLPEKMSAKPNEDEPMPVAALLVKLPKRFNDKNFCNAKS